jgi:hypothetical protein
MVGVKYLGNRIFGGVSSAIILIVFVSSFFIIDSPAQTRNKQIDAQTVSSMQNLTYTLQDYADAHQGLPATLDSISPSYTSQISQTKNPVAYNKLNDTSYKLCANFNSSNMTDKNPTSDVYQLSDDSWKHDKGNVCFTKNITLKPKPYAINSDPSADNQVTMPAQIPADLDISMLAARKKAQIANIKSNMSSALPSGIICRDGQGEVISGIGGDPICKGGKGIGNMTWPNISGCGPEPSDTKWTVFAGNTDNWNFTLTCANITDCNGPANALCSSVKCNFGGSCP